MQKENTKKYMVDFVFTLCLFGVFAVSALLVVVIGANVYRSIVGTQDANSAKRATLAYVAEKIRQSDEEGSISIGSVQGSEALVLESRYGEAAFRTYIYWFDGSLRELFTKADVTPTLIAGQEITEVSGFSIEPCGDDLYLASATDKNGDTMTLYISARCGDVQENTP